MNADDIQIIDFLDDDDAETGLLLVACSRCGWQSELVDDEIAQRLADEHRCSDEEDRECDAEPAG